LIARAGSYPGRTNWQADVREANKKKPVTAYIEDLGASAAYWVASQAGKIYSNEPGFVGSIGTYLVVEDWSGAAEGAWASKVHVVKAGEFKGAGYPGTPVTDAQLRGVAKAGQPGERDVSLVGLSRPELADSAGPAK
jgi:ClpP class serine protease